MRAPSMRSSREIAISRWYFKTTRSIRICRCTRTWRSRCATGRCRARRSMRACVMRPKYSASRRISSAGRSSSRAASVSVSPWDGPLFAILGLHPYLRRRPKQLAGRQRQRVSMGRAIVRKPRLFLFDEPLSNLDAKLRSDIRLEIGQLVRRLGVTALYVTHDHVEAMTLADRIAVLRAGRLLQVGTPREVYERPATSFVGAFLGTPRMNLIAARAQGDAIAAGPFRVPRPGGALPAR